MNIGTQSVSICFLLEEYTLGVQILQILIDQSEQKKRRYLRSDWLIQLVEAFVMRNEVHSKVLINGIEMEDTTWCSQLKLAILYCLLSFRLKTHLALIIWR